MTLFQNFRVLLYILALAAIASAPLTSRAQGGLSVPAPGGKLIPEKHLGAATASYFAKDGHVTVQVRPLRVAGDERTGVVLIPSFIVRGRKVVEPRLVNPQFIVDSPARARPPLSRVQIFADGQELAAGVPRLLTTSKPSGGTVTRVLMYNVPYGKFLRMIEGREVRISLGHARLDLTGDHLAAMRDLRRMILEGVSFP